jgi:curved DNA-binding protein CbpA
MSRRREADPFATLGLPAQPGLGDDEVRAAWRRMAAATHPDRADGGDPARFAAAAAAYTTLRTRFGRGEALADLARPAGRPRPGRLGWQRACAGRRAYWHASGGGARRCWH